MKQGKVVKLERKPRSAPSERGPSPKRYLPFVVIAAVGLATVAAGAMLLRAKQRPAAAVTATDASGHKVGAQPPHVRGQADAPVTIEEFGDFECPPCAGISRGLDKLKQDYPAGLRVIFRHFPLAKHKHALDAAHAAEAAGLQGRFWEMHDLLFQQQATWHYAPNPRSLFVDYAGRLGLDVERFRRDAASDHVKARVTADRERAASLGIAETPTLFLNGKQVPKTFLAPDRLRTAVDAALNGKPAF